MSPLPPINSSSQKDAAVWLARLGYVIPLQREGSLNLTMTDLGGKGNKYELKSSIKPVPVMSWHPPEGLPFKNTHVHIGPQGEPLDQGLLPRRNKKERGFPGGQVVGFVCQCRGHRFDPWSGKTAHAMEQLSLCTTTTEPVLLNLGAATPEPMCCNYQSPGTYSLSSARRSCHNEKPTPCNEE